MKNIYLVSEIENLLLDEKLNREKIKDKIPVMEKEIYNIFPLIRGCKSVESAEEYFNLLDIYQKTAAKLLFKYKFAVSEKLERFISDFDRLDDLRARSYLFLKIRNDPIYMV